MSLIKVNYNNAAVKRARGIIPYMFCYRQLTESGWALVVEIDARMPDEPFYDNFLFELLIDGEAKAYVDRGSAKNEEGRYVLTFELPNIGLDTIYAQVRGTYTDRYGNRRTFVKDALLIRSYLFADEELICGEQLTCNEAIYGYLVDGTFYTEREEVYGDWEYDGAVDPTSWTGDFVDIPSDVAYEWNGDSSSFIVSYQ